MPDVYPNGYDYVDLHAVARGNSLGITLTYLAINVSNRPFPGRGVSGTRLRCAIGMGGMRTR